MIIVEIPIGRVCFQRSFGSDGGLELSVTVVEALDMGLRARNGSLDF